MRTKGNTILITGGSSGIGRGLAEAFHKRGNKVIIAGRRKVLLDEIIKVNPGMQGVELDVSDLASIQRAAKEVLANNPSLNVVINNAGIMPLDNPAKEIDDETSVKLVTTNILGPIRVSSAFIEHLKKQKESYIINNSSVLAFVPLVSSALYSATKAAIHSYTMSQRFALRNSSVKVIEISPPWVDTDLVYKSGDPRAMQLPDFIAQTMSKLETDAIEAIVDSAAPFRDNPGRNEHEFFNQLNLDIEANPIPTAA